MVSKLVLVDEIVKKTLAHLPADMMNPQELRVLLSGLFDIYKRAAVQAVLENMAAAKRIRILAQLRIGFKQKSAIKELLRSMPYHEVAVREALLKCQSSVLETYRNQVEQRLRAA